MLARLSALCVPILLAALNLSASTQSCGGCTGAGESGGASNGTGEVSITVTMESGKCKWLYATDPPMLDCREFDKCKATIERSWSGLPPSSPLDFCITIAGNTYCLTPQPNSGPTGEGMHQVGPLMVPCGQGAIWTVTAGSLVGTAAGNCSPCTE